MSALATFPCSQAWNVVGIHQIFNGVEGDDGHAQRDANQHHPYQHRHGSQLAQPAAHNRTQLARLKSHDHHHSRAR
jgi:hypothetical protein